MKKLFLFFILSFCHFSFAQLSPNVRPSFLRPSGIVELNKNVRAKAPLVFTKNGLPNIVLIGYWPPTNEMMREFSPLGDWKGENWRGLGYNIYAFFPEFTNGLGKGEGDFQVDYQATSKDFWRIVPSYKPVALFSFGLSSPNHDWEIEIITRNSTFWYKDFLSPKLPTPSPPDDSLEANAERVSTYPVDAVINALKTEVPTLNPYADYKGAGTYLCEYLGYHISWYRSLFPEQVRFGAHIHIGGKNKVEDLKKALKIKLEKVIENL